MKKQLLILLMSLVCITQAWAYDFAVDGIYYNKISDNEVEVTYRVMGNSYTYTGEVIIPASITTEGVEYKVTRIGDWAFFYNVNLVSVNIPDEIETIGKEAFAQCSKMKSINVADDNTTYSSLDGVLFNKDQSSLICYPARKEEYSYTVPATVKEIEKKAFYNPYESHMFVTIELPDGLIKIAENSLPSMFHINIPASVESIEANAIESDLIKVNWRIPLDEVSELFTKKNYTGKYSSTLIVPEGTKEAYQNHAVWGNFSLIEEDKEGTESDFVIEDGVLVSYKGYKEHIVIPDNVTTIKQSVFERKNYIKSVVIPGTVKAVGNYAFRNCYSLASITIEDGVKNIGLGAFSGCLPLTSLVIPKSVISIGEYEYYSERYCDIAGVCPYLEAIEVDDANPAFCSVDGVLYNKEKTELLFYPYGKKDRVYIVPEGTEKINPWAMVTTSVSFITGRYPLSLSSIVIPESLTAFSLHNIFGYPLETIEVKWKNLTNVDPISATYGKTLIVPAGTKSLYQNAEGWKDFETIIEKASSGISFVEEDNAGEDKQGSIQIALEVPRDETFNGSFTITLPAGFTLDLDLTSMAEALAGKYILNITALPDNSWKIEITSKAQKTRSANYVYREIMNIIYKVDESVEDNIYKAQVKDVEFEFEGGDKITDSEVEINLTVGEFTNIELPTAKPVIDISGNTIQINTLHAETVSVYSVTGVLLNTFTKPEGEASFELKDSHSKQVLIIRGSSGWTHKMIK